MPKHTRKERKARAGKGAKTAALEQKCKEVEKLLREEELNKAMISYQIGIIVVEIEDDPDTYGSGAVKMLATKTNVDKATLYDCGQVARRWKRAEFEKLLKKKSVNGRPLSWSLLVELAGIEDSKERDSMTKATLEKDLSVRALRAHADHSKESAEAATGEENRPSGTWTVLTGLRGMVAYTQERLDTASRWDKQILEPIENMTDRDERLLPLLSEVIDALGKSSEMESTVVGRLEKVRASLQRPPKLTSPSKPKKRNEKAAVA